MAYGIVSLERKMFLDDIESVIGLIWRRYQRTPGNTIPLLSSMIISLPSQRAQHGHRPDALVAAMTKDLQGVFDRIYPDGADKRVTVSVTYDMDVTGTKYDVNVTFAYVTPAGDIRQTGGRLSLGTDGRLILPEDSLSSNFV